MPKITNAERSLRVRFSEDGDPVAMTSSEFRVAVAAGSIVESTPVWGKIFTNGEWWTAADLYMFHVASPKQVPFGAHLKAELRAKEREREEHARGFAAADALRRRRAEDVAGVVRRAMARFAGAGLDAGWLMTIEPALRGERVLVVEQGSTELQLQLVEFSVDDRGEAAHAVVYRAEQRLSLDQAPSLARNSLELESVVRNAPAVENRRCLDGVSYQFEYTSSRLCVSERWVNPNESHASQRRLIGLTHDLIQAAFPDRR